MIQKQELLDLAKDFGLRPDVVEKDYVLGWLLAGIGEHPATRDTWVFKGGTCLKKCFFETYRFSEDLDLRSPTQRIWTMHFCANCFKELANGCMSRLA